MEKKMTDEKPDSLIWYCKKCGWADDQPRSDLSHCTSAKCKCDGRMHYIRFKAGVEDDQVADILSRARAEAHNRTLNVGVRYKLDPFRRPFHIYLDEFSPRMLDYAREEEAPK